ncbi:PREDICTED: uncharacterized protein LOC109156262 [Ipomoea nil]|uniref:uncharacterized protein LOC109156262 n=1 Tax=Ipomoea nil TaxID=35883 RepID=UPI0009008586|nr:PREDICTED: uncharacterized protein LOC109156262 [Ipomoea nil]
MGSSSGSIEGGKAKPLKQPKADKKEYDERWLDIDSPTSRYAGSSLLIQGEGAREKGGGGGARSPWTSFNLPETQQVK